MPVPNSIDDLEPVPADNYPAGSEPVFPNLDNYLRSHAAFIAQLRDLLGTAGSDIESIEEEIGTVNAALALRVAKTSDTGAAILPEGDDSERPASGEIPDGSLVVRGNTQDVDNYIAEYWDRVTSAWRAFASRTWVGQQISSAVNGLQTQINALKAIRYEPEALWTGNTGAVVELTLSREVLEGEMLVLKHVAANTGLTNPQVYLPSVGTQVDGGTYFAFNTGSVLTGATLRKPAVAGGPSVMKMLTYTSGYSVAGIYAIKQIP